LVFLKEIFNKNFINDKKKFFFKKEVPNPVMLFTVLMFKKLDAIDPYIFGLIVNVISKSGFTFFKKKKKLKNRKMLLRIEVLLLEKLNCLGVIFFILTNFL
tara:strand:+ start:4317 stop:4619 length:303 start_codon:yes stop_codon:yes gene_type:complete